MMFDFERDMQSGFVPNIHVCNTLWMSHLGIVSATELMGLYMNTYAS